MTLATHTPSSVSLPTKPGKKAPKPHVRSMLTPPASPQPATTRKRREVRVSHPRLPTIKRGSTFETPEDALAKLGVTIEESTYNIARWFSPATWNAMAVEDSACYDRERRILRVHTGGGRRKALSWGIGAALASQTASDWKMPEVAMWFFNELRLNVRHWPAELEELPGLGLRVRDDNEHWHALAQRYGVDVVQAHPDIENIFDLEDRQEVFLQSGGYPEKVLVVLPAEPADSDYEWLSESLGIDVRPLPVTMRPCDKYFVKDAERAARVLREWRAARADSARQLVDEAFGRVPATPSLV